MLKIFSNRMKNQNGFTLIELIVVIAIIGILGAIVVPKFNGFRESAAEKADEATAVVIANAVKLAYMDGETFETEGKTILQALVDLDLLEEEPTPQVKKIDGTDINEFHIFVDDDGNVKVDYNDGSIKQLYPAE